MLEIKKATRGAKKARICIAGPAGSGKTMSALLIAKGLIGGVGKTVLFDSERGSATLYADDVGFEYDHANLPNYNYRTYIDALKQGAQAGYDVVIIDSISHCWEDILDQHKKMQGNSFANWGKVMPWYQELVNTIVNHPAHIIVTTRAKMKYEQDPDTKKVSPIGLDPVMRDGFEYEMDVFMLIDIDHNAAVKKTRLSKLADRIISRPGEELGKEIAVWLAGASPTREVDDATLQAVRENIARGDFSTLGDHKVESDCSMKGKSVLEVVSAHRDWLDKVMGSPKVLAKLKDADRVALLEYAQWAGSQLVAENVGGQDGTSSVEDV